MLYVIYLRSYPQVMYIISVAIENIRSIKKIAINFEKGTKSTILTGDNGTGKSTILRSIAMGLTDEDSAAAVLREMPGEMVRKGQPFGLITINLYQSNRKKYKITTKILSQKFFEKVKQTVFEFSNGEYKKMDPEDFHWDAIFATGYGAGVRNLGTTDYQYYVAIDALYSLFKYDVALQNPELSIRRMIARAKESEGDEGASWMENYLMQLLKDILNLNKKDQVVLTSTSIEVISKEWGRSELSTLGDGYISTITWILDLFSWWMLHLKLRKKNIIKDIQINGIVLIDEIEQHLHPIWQIKIMGLLQKAFPKIQFITTTHSPLVALNSTGKFITNKQLKIHVLSWKSGNVMSSVVKEPLSELSYNQMLGSEAFGFLHNGNQALENVLKEMSKIAAIDDPNPKQVKQLNNIKSELKNIMFPQGMTLIEREVERDYKKDLIEGNQKLRDLLK